MFSIKDKDFPNYKEVSSPTTAANITDCQNTTNDTKDKPCRVENKDLGWYIILKDKMNANIKIKNIKKISGEKLGTIIVKSSILKLSLIHI